MVKPVVVYGCETWSVAEVDMKRMNAWERKILRRITSGRTMYTEINPLKTESTLLRL
jgi:hypothetical protein